MKTKEDRSLGPRAAHRALSRLVLGLGLAVGALAQSPDPSIIHDVSRDFSHAANPNGVWSYGWKSELAGAFTLLSVPETFTVENGVSFRVWWFASRTMPMVECNTTTNTAIHDSGQGIYPPGTVVFHPGHDGWPQDFSVIRFTVPSDGGGSYRLESAVQSHLDGDRSGDTDYHVVVNGGEVFGEFLPPRSATGYTNILTLAPGDIVDFMVGRGADGSAYGSGLKIHAALRHPAICIPHAATATARVDNGFVVEATIDDGGCGYTNAPLVRITGGGGSGASAAATITDGVVTGITITSAGIGYTAAPIIQIASPPFMPWLEIGVKTVKVTQHVVLGQNYLLESSPDLSEWSQVGSRFTADNEVIVQEFDVDMTGRYFRLRQVP